MFGDINKLEEMKQKINSVSPSFCLAKWMHVTIHLLTGHTHSCYLPPTHKIPVDEIKRNPAALHNTSYKKQQRKKMLEGKRPEECGICWGVEDLPGNQVSDRHLRAIDSWTMPYFDKVRQLPWDADINPTYLEVSFSSLCNFRCSYCAPNVSTAWEDEVRKLGPYKLSTGDHQNIEWMEKAGTMPIPEDQPNPYIEAFWKWWPDLVKDLHFFRVTGGEPLLSKHAQRILEWLNENPQPHLELSFNSNLRVPQNYFERFIGTLKPVMEQSKVKTFMLHTSLDTWGTQAEYIRHGLKFEEFQRNLHRFLTELPNASVAFMSTFNNLSIVGYKRFLDWVLELRQQYNSETRSVLLDIPHLMGPSHQSVKILTPRYLGLVDDLIAYMESKQSDHHGFRKAEVDKMKRIREWMASPSDQGWLDRSQRDFYLFFMQHDLRRGTDFLKTFPEMKDFWDHCKSMANAAT